MNERVIVRKIRSVWSADCRLCPMSLGFVLRPTHGLALAWALSHVKWHTTPKQYIEITPDGRVRR